MSVLYPYMSSLTRTIFYDFVFIHMNCLVVNDRTSYKQLLADESSWLIIVFIKIKWSKICSYLAFQLVLFCFVEH